MFKRKKTGCETPEYRKPTIPPQYNPPPMPLVKAPTPGTKLRHALTQVCGRLCDQADEVAKQIEESGFEKPTLVIKLFSDDTITVYINEEDDEIFCLGGTEE